MDEGTQHYYYWNTKTNAVTWEIPDDFSQYLLQMKEFEDELKAYEKKMKDYEAAMAELPKDQM